MRVILNTGTVLPCPIVRAAVCRCQPHPVHLTVVMLLPYGQGEVLPGPGGVHEMKIEGKKTCQMVIFILV